MNEANDPVTIREVGLRVAGRLEGEALHGNIRRAGLPKTMLQAA
jgi:hypothetical protein